MEGVRDRGGRIAAVPFAVQMSSVSSTTINGEVTSFVYPRSLGCNNLKATK